MGRYGSATTILGRLPSGLTVTMSLYKASDGSSVAITNTCTEIGSTGVFRWATSNITTQPTVETEYFYRMTTGQYQYEGKFSLISKLDAVYALVNDLETRLTATRAGYLDNLSAGAVALAATALSDVTWTGAKAGHIDAAISGVPAGVWDRILTGATHNIAASAGRRVREIGAFAIHAGTAQAGNSHSITLAASASPSDAAYHGIYNRNLLVLTDNTGVGQTRTVVDYDAITKIVVVDRDWRISPDNTTAYQITPDDTPLTVDHGVAQGGTSRTITIRDYAASDDDAYLCNIVTIIAGTGRGQARLVDAYNGTTKVVTICGDDWVVTPDTSSIYVMMPYGVACAACIGSDALKDLVKTAGVLL